MVVRMDNLGRSGDQPGFDEEVACQGPLPLVDAQGMADDLNILEMDGDHFYQVRKFGSSLAKFEI